MVNGLPILEVHTAVQLGVISKSIMTSFYILLWLSISHATSSPEPINFHYLPGLIDKTYTQLGDINIGAVMMTKGFTTNADAAHCEDTFDLTGTLDKTEAMAFAVDLINRDPHLLPNVTIGHVTKGACAGSGLTFATTLSFLPRSEYVCNGSVCTTKPSTSPDPHWVAHDVIGVLPAAISSYTIPVSHLLSVARVPMMGYLVTSDDLSDKSEHPYFLRIVPPDKYQVQAMLKFISTNGWTYISVIYSDSSYGQKAFRHLYQNTEQYGICIATSLRLGLFPQYDQIVSDLMFNSRARAVVLFVGHTTTSSIMKAVHDNNATGHFIWIGGDYLFKYPEYSKVGGPQDPAIGTFHFDFYTTEVPEFYAHLRKMRVYRTTNPWFKRVWELLMECSFDQETCDPEADVLLSTKYQPRKDTALIIDSVLTFAHAAHKLLSEKCATARGQDARRCITGELLLEYLKTTSFDGFSGRIEFDENQDMKRKYTIHQLVYDYPEATFLQGTDVAAEKRLFWTKIGYYETNKNEINYFDEIAWSHLNKKDRIVPWTEDSLPIEVPESVCSGPCEVGEYRIEKKLSCCWECKRCRDNEFLVNGNTSCQVCPLFMWPDPTTAFTTCIDIPLTYPRMDETIPIVLTSVAILTLLVTLFICVCYFKHRNERVIKASSKELSAIQLVAIFTGYTTVILFQATPNEMMCSAIFFLFCMSFVLLYSPLLVKTIRIFRIFQSGTKNEKPRFVSSTPQLFFAITFIAVQIILCILIYLLYSPGAQRTQPILTQKMVELSCDLTLPGLASFLGYNIFLVSLCSGFAFMVRKLPDNFNESKFISMCVATTLLIWLAFIPTYFTADREYIRIFLLSVALLLNHSVALIFLFVPKIYAAIFLPSDAGTFSSNRS